MLCLYCFYRFRTAICGREPPQCAETNRAGAGCKRDDGGVFRYENPFHIGADHTALPVEAQAASLVVGDSRHRLERRTAEGGLFLYGLFMLLRLFTEHGVGTDGTT